MARLNANQLASLWVQAGGNPASAKTAAAIALAESGGRTDALNPRAPDYSVGPWQINYYGNLRGPRTQQFGTPQQLLSNPLANARAAVAISQGGKNFNPWSTYKSGAYRNQGVGNLGAVSAGPQVQTSYTSAGAPQAGPPAPGGFTRLAMSFINNWGKNTPRSTESILGAIMQLRQSQYSPASQIPGMPPANIPSTLGARAGVPGPGKIIGTPYQGTHTLGNWESDNAVDVAMPYGTPVRAVADGVIGNQFGSLGSGGRFAGLRAHLVTGDNEYYYAHLSRFADGIRPGAHVKAGQVIGFSGAANGVNHLHFGEKAGNPTSIYS